MNMKMLGGMALFWSTVFSEYVRLLFAMLEELLAGFQRSLTCLQRQGLACLFSTGLLKAS